MSQYNPRLLGLASDIKAYVKVYKTSVESAALNLLEFPSPKSDLRYLSQLLEVDITYLNSEDTEEIP